MAVCGFTAGQAISHECGFQFGAKLYCWVINVDGDKSTLKRNVQNCTFTPTGLESNEIVTSEEGGGGGDSNKWSVEIQKAKGGSIKSEIEGRSLLMITLGSWYERDIRYFFF